MSDEKKDNERLLVAVRIRPMRNDEKSRGYKITCEKFDDNTVTLYAKPSNPNNALGENRSSNRQYVFDFAYGSDSSQEEIYVDTIKPLVEKVLQGFNATAFAYGATGGGKTYTMVGNEHNPGCMVRAMDDLFRALESKGTLSYKVSMSYLEIYNENIRDLLDPKSGHLELRDDTTGRHPHVIGLSEVSTQNTEEVMRLLRKGNKQRTEEATAANKYSSRSHAILIVNVKQSAAEENERHDNGKYKYGRLYMIDLAGSEKASQTKNEGARLREGAHINRALLALGNCINALASNKKSFVNYRDSKLTRLLKESLSGNCYTVMIVNVSPCDRHREETRNTLVYADRAKNISNKVQRNALDVSYHVSQYQNLISELRSEIGRLKERMTSPGEEELRKSHRLSSAELHNKNELKEIRDAIVQNFKEQMKMRHKLLEIENHLLGLTMEFEKQNIIINDSYQKSSEFSRKRRVIKMKSGLEDYESGIEDMESNGKHVRDQESEEDEEEDVSEEGESSEPEEVRAAWTELQHIQKEQERYHGLREDLEQDLIELKKVQSHLEEELPKRITTDEEKEILSLLCRVHELEIDKIEIQREGYLKEFEVRKRDLIIFKYDKQRSLCDEIISRQKHLIEEMSNSKNKKDTKAGNSSSMPPELMGMYSLYQQEMESRANDTHDLDYASDLNSMFRSPSTLSLRGSVEEDKIEKRKPSISASSSAHSILPPIGSRMLDQKGDKLFHPSRVSQDHEEHFKYSDDSLSVSSSRPSSDMGMHDFESGVPMLPPISSKMYRSHSVSDNLHQIPYRSSLLHQRNVSTSTSSKSYRPEFLSSPKYMERKTKDSGNTRSRKKESSRTRKKSKSRNSLFQYGVPMMRY